MTLGVVVPCYRQERFLPRTVAALERALAGREWRGAIVRAAPGDDAPLPPLSPRWTVLAPDSRVPLTPGAARNAGFAACGGAWVLFVDADVEIEAAWVSRALTLIEGAAPFAGAWGPLDEWFEDRGRERPGVRDLHRVGAADADADHLAGLALVRRDALAAAGGYDERLHSEEDFELGMRLRRAGFRLRTLAPLAGRHWSGPRPSFGEIGRRWRAGLCFGPGEALRLYVGRPGFGRLARRNAHYLGTLAVAIAAPVALATGGPRALAAWAIVPLAGFAVMTARKRSPRIAAHSLLTWLVMTAGLVVGFVRGGAPRAALAGEGAC